MSLLHRLGKLLFEECPSCNNGFLHKVLEAKGSEDESTYRAYIVTFKYEEYRVCRSCGYSRFIKNIEKSVRL